MKVEIRLSDFQQLFDYVVGFKNRETDEKLMVHLPARSTNEDRP